MTPAKANPAQAPDIPLWMLFPLFFAAIFLSHWTLLHLPYFWDEAGYYIPAAWDLFRTGTLIPVTTASNAHPPLPSLLLAAWWHLSGFVIIGTRTFVCFVSAAALLAVFKIARTLTNSTLATVTAFLTAIYPVWFAQSTLAHADIFAAAFTLWGLALYIDHTLEPKSELGTSTDSNACFWSAGLFALAALSKETAILTPCALAAWEACLYLKSRRSQHLGWIAALTAPLLPLIAWYAYHHYRTGFTFGNPEFLRYNATANLDAYRVALGLWHRFLHLAVHMNMFVPVACAVATLFIPTNSKSPSAISRSARNAIAIVIVSHWLAFSILGGALLTRYLLPAFPLIIFLCVATWHRHLRQWPYLAALSAIAFLSAIWINPPYAFAPEDNLTYRDMIVLHQHAVQVIETRFPAATVLTAWPATSELTRPELGYSISPIKVTPIQNFSSEEIQKAAADPSGYDTALIFSTKWAPPAGHLNLGKQNVSADVRYFDFHRDLSPSEVAAILHGEIVWQARRKGEWAAVLHFPRIVNAGLSP